MKFVTLFRCRLPMRQHWRATSIWMHGLVAILGTSVLVCAPSQAQMSKHTASSPRTSEVRIPNAPIPTSPPQNISLKNKLASLAIGADSSITANSASTGDVSFYTVVDLALRNSRAVRVAEADRQRAAAALSETRDAYIPNLSIGSGLGYSYGFPLGTPTLFNVTSNGLLFSFSQRDYIRSTRAALKAATFSLKNTRQQIILDTALNYIELGKTLAQITALNEAIGDTDTLIAVIEQRMQAGLEAKVNVTRAQLRRAQIRLQSIQMQDHADELQKHLAGLTGLGAATIVPSTSSVPQLPDLDFQSLLEQDGKAPLVQAAFATANSKMFEYFGDKRQNYRPTINFAFQYARFSTFNGYDQYYINFQKNNIGVGIQAVWPLFDPLRRDKAIESKAKAEQARQQAELNRIQTDESNFALWHSLRELQAQETVAKLQQELAKDTLSSTLTQMNLGSVTSGVPITPQQAALSRIDERTSYVAVRDAQFNVTRVKLNLLNAVGQLEDWVQQSSQAGH